MPKVKVIKPNHIHEGKEAKIGDVIDVSEAALKAFKDKFEVVVDSGKKQKTKNEITEEELEELLDEYDTGNGWYKLPGMEKSVRKDEAIKILKETE